ncbi:MAG: alpha/beta hydrolase [Acidimicrobiales bacterium]
MADPSSSSPLPLPRTVVLVHGAFHGAWCWAGLQAALDRRGVPSFAVDLPGHGVSTEPLADLHGDAEAVSAVVARLADEGADELVLVGHSYGGAVISQAELGGRVNHLVYLSALVPDEGQDPSSVMAGFPPPPTGTASGGASQGSGLFVRNSDGTMGADPALGRPVFYNTCTAEQAAAAVARLGPQRAATFKQPSTRANWRTVPSTYIRCLQDKAVPLGGQDAMAERCNDVVDIDTDHSPFLCAPDRLADLLVPLAGR